MSEVFTREIARGQREFDTLRGEIAGTEVLKLDEHAFAHACSMYLALPGLRGFWPMSSVAYTNPQGLDTSGNGNHLTNNNVCDFGYSAFIPHVDFDGTTQYLSRADGGAANWADITTTETYIVADAQGLTIGGWWKVDDAIPAATEVLIGKWGPAFATQAYQIARSLLTGRFFFSASGAAASNNIPSTVDIVTTAWYFVVGRFKPLHMPGSPELKIWVNEDTWSTTTGPPSIKDVTSDFAIGARSGGADYYDGKASLCFLCATKVPDATIMALFYQTRDIFGV